MRNPEDTKFVWDKKNFDIIKNTLNNNMKDLKNLLNSPSISEGEVLNILPHDLHNEWDNFMRGKTCPILDNGDHGVYSWDLSQFINIIEKPKLNL